MQRVRLAVLGGTFDHLHAGHHALLASAFRVGREVGIGLTTDRFVAAHPKPWRGRIQSYAVRKAALTRWIRHNFPGRKFWIAPLDEPFGRSVEPGVDVLVLSPETLAGGRAVNRERRRRREGPVRLLVVPLALADDLEPVSSRRVRAGTIRADGRRLSPLRVAVLAPDPQDRHVAERSVRRVFPRVRWAGSADGSRRAQTPPELWLRIARRPGGGWTVTEWSSWVRLRPRVIPGDSPVDLERGLTTLLRPRL